MPRIEGLIELTRPCPHVLVEHDRRPTGFAVVGSLGGHSSTPGLAALAGSSLAASADTLEHASDRVTQAKVVESSMRLARGGCRAVGRDLGDTRYLFRASSVNDGSR